MSEIRVPGPLVWAWAIVGPMFLIAGIPVWWPYWFIHAAAIYVLADYFYKKWNRIGP